MPTRKIANPDGPDQGQKQPSRPRRAILTGGAVGLAAVAGSTFGRAQPASAQGNTQPVVELLPANPADPSGATDAANIKEAFSLLPSQVTTRSALTLATAGGTTLTMCGSTISWARMRSD